MSRSKEQVQVSLLLLGLGLALTALLFVRRKEVDGFQTTTSPVLKADGVIIYTSLAKLTYGSDKVTNPDKIRIIDQSTNIEVWSTGMAPSTSSDDKNYVILYPSPKSITLPTNFDSPEQNTITAPASFGILVDFIKLDSETSYTNALNGTDIIEAYGTRVKIDTTKFYPALGSTTNPPTGFDSVYDPTTKKTIWSKGQAAPAPDGTKEILLLSTKRVFAYLKDINAAIDSSENKTNTDYQLIYPVTRTSTSDGYIDSRTVKYDSVKFTPRSTVLLRYGGIGVGVVAVGALLFIAFRAFTKPASPSISLNSIPVATVVSPPPNTAKQNATKPNGTKPNNKGATVAL